MLGSKTEVSVQLVDKVDRDVLANLSQLYQHDMAVYFEVSPENLPQSSGKYSPLPYLEEYWTGKDRFPFLIRLGESPVGFALVNKVGSSPKADWNMAEFFIIRQCRGNGIGRFAARQLFQQFPGLWEVAVIPENKEALGFWCRVLPESEPHLRTIAFPQARQMYVLSFDPQDPKVEQEINIVEEPLSRDVESVLREGFKEHSIQCTGSDGEINAFTYTARLEGKLIGAVIAKTFWGALHIKNLWVSEEYRGHGLGIALMKRVLDRGRQAGCPFAYVETLSFQAVDFYKLLGFNENFVRHGYNRGVAFYYLEKSLIYDPGTSS